MRVTPDMERKLRSAHTPEKVVRAVRQLQQEKCTPSPGLMIKPELLESLREIVQFVVPAYAYAGVEECIERSLSLVKVDPGSAVATQVRAWVTTLLDPGEPVLVRARRGGKGRNILRLDKLYLLERVLEEGESGLSTSELHLTGSVTAEALQRTARPGVEVEILALEELYPLPVWETALTLWSPWGGGAMVSVHQALQAAALV